MIAIVGLLILIVFWVALFGFGFVCAAEMHATMEYIEETISPMVDNVLEVINNCNSEEKLRAKEGWIRSSAKTIRERLTAMSDHTEYGKYSGIDFENIIITKFEEKLSIWSKENTASGDDVAFLPEKM